MRIQEASSFDNNLEQSILSGWLHEGATPRSMSAIRINVEEVSNGGKDIVRDIETTAVAAANPLSWHIPRPSLVGRSERDSENGSWAHHLHPNSPSRGSTSSQGSTASTHSAASGTLLLTAANLANLAAIHPPTVTSPKQMDTASVASSTHFTVVNGLGRPTTVYRKSWCARNQLTVLVCTMSFLFMVGLLAGILYMEMRARDKYN
ncbi:PREDICTED: uncharacterized protein LOC108775543 [Cyphomyrmex costatus]|uniref:Uncharacterized protein n=1 Tax=Cyphomyrmex costatus TaxID=456900 RepID=A0A195CJW3_9HYME|nr:PREDICTED: uncharacterized protein LOC108775543 [Cyphomyrmex costatus]KYN01003.1 hypothetical protein ALC62_08229 [Cyphomyrmex costatus]